MMLKAHTNIILFSRASVTILTVSDINNYYMSKPKPFLDYHIRLSSNCNRYECLFGTVRLREGALLISFQIAVP